MNNIAKIEALLFVAGDEGLSLDILSKLTHLGRVDVLTALGGLVERYENTKDSGLTLIETANAYQIVTKKEYAEYIKEYAQSPYSQRLSRPLLETLAIVAYKQPITRIEIEEIRGVQVTGNLQKLRARQLIKEVGRLEKPGQPLLYGTTDFFLDYFGINSLEELPELMEESSEEEMTDLFFKSYQDTFNENEQVEQMNDLI